jgi:hypothetical protein
MVFDAVAATALGDIVPASGTLTHWRVVIARD